MKNFCSKFIQKMVAVFFLCILSSFAMSAPPQEKIDILTSIFPLFEFAQAVSGGRGHVDLLLPSGAEVHTWKPKPSDIFKTAQADLFIVVGTVLEPWLDDLLRSLQDPKPLVLEVSLGYRWEGHEEEAEEEDRLHAHERGDPHIWLDFEYDIQIIEQIRAALSQIDPSNADEYRSNSHKISDKLRNLDNRYREELGRCQHRTFILGGHSAFGYIAERYNLNQVAVHGLSPDSLPTPRKLIETIQIAKDKRVNAVYFEATLSDEIARMIADEVGCQTLALHPGANVSREERQSGLSFFDIMEKNLENLKIGLIYR